MCSPRNGETAQAKNFKTEAVIKLQKSLNPHLLQQVGKCNLLWERDSTRTNPQKKMESLLQPLKSTFPHLMFQARVFWLTGKRVCCCPRLPLTALQQRFGQVTNQADMGKEVHGVLPPPPVQRRAVQSLSSGDEINLIFEEHTVHYLLVSLFILLFNSVRDFRHVVRRLVFIFSQLTKCLEVWVIWSNTPLK